jgi:hypothetical protein
MKTCIQTALGILLAASIATAAASIVKTRINEANILTIFSMLQEIKIAIKEVDHKINDLREK